MAGAARGDGGSPDVYVNDNPSLRESDSSSVTDYDRIISGSASVYVNDKAKARYGDPTEDDPIPEGSPDVDVGP